VLIASTIVDGINKDVLVVEFDIMNIFFDGIKDAIIASFVLPTPQWGITLSP